MGRSRITAFEYQVIGKMENIRVHVCVWVGASIWLYKVIEFVNSKTVFGKNFPLPSKLSTLKVSLSYDIC